MMISTVVVHGVMVSLTSVSSARPTSLFTGAHVPGASTPPYLPQDQRRGKAEAKEDTSRGLALSNWLAHTKGRWPTVAPHFSDRDGTMRCSRIARSEEAPKGYFKQQEPCFKWNLIQDSNP